MKKIIIVPYFICAILLGCCTGSTTRSAEKVAQKLYTEYKAYKALPKSCASQYRKMKKAQNILEELFNPTVECPLCNGYGQVIMMDSWGQFYWHYDAFGNIVPTVYICPACNGEGFVSQ